jgi:aspartyl/asparaginyl-tRNA synthetase
MHGGIKELIELETEFVEYLGFGDSSDYVYKNYEEMAAKYDVSILEAEDELKIYDEYGPIFFLENFPERTNPFWNMKRNGATSNKVDVLMHGIETIGSAERSTDAEEQRNSFYTIEDGKYAEKLFELFGKNRVEDELEDFLSHDFFPRSGGGLGVPRMIRAFELSGLI